jgi:hypothetical protein
MRHINSDFQKRERLAENAHVKIKSCKKKSNNLSGSEILGTRVAIFRDKQKSQLYSQLNIIEGGCKNHEWPWILWTRIQLLPISSQNVKGYLTPPIPLACNIISWNGIWLVTIYLKCFVWLLSLSHIDWPLLLLRWCFSRLFIAADCSVSFQGALSYLK